MLKMGDKVFISDKLTQGRQFDKIMSVSKGMLLYIDKEATITSVLDAFTEPKIRYRINLDGGRWVWTDKMFKSKILNWKKVIKDAKV